jgi:hypothetical protein
MSRSTIFNLAIKTGVVSYGGINIIGSSWAIETVLNNTVASGGNSLMIVDGRNGKPYRISNITFDGTIIAEADFSRGLLLFASNDVRVDHCQFIDCNIAFDKGGQYGISSVHRGIVDHCTFDFPYWDIYGGAGGAYGIIDAGDGTPQNWSPLEEMVGQYRNDSAHSVLVVENCNFTRCRYAIACTRGGYAIFRFNHVSLTKPIGYACIDVHERGSANEVGGRGLEAYNNTLDGTGTLIDGFKLRCGSTIAYNNTMIVLGDGFELQKTGTPDFVNQTYIWSNIYTNVAQQINPSGYYVENVHYFRYAFPNYMPYPYPHHEFKVTKNPIMPIQA